MIRSIIVFLFLAVVAGCGDRPFQLRPGDVVKPELVVTDPWKSGSDAVLNSWLQVRSLSGAVRRLPFESVPYECEPTMEITFFREDEALSTQTGVVLKRDC